MCAGSQTGALKIWDLEAVKIVRTLTGHKSAVRCMDFHPYGDFLASGSSDANIKVSRPVLSLCFASMSTSNFLIICFNF